MNLDEILFNCLSAFTNIDNNIRQQAEQNYFTIIEEENNAKVLLSLINIVNQYRQSTVSYSALIQTRKLLEQHLFDKSLNDDFIINLRNTFFQFFIDQRFTLDMHRYIMQVISLFYIHSMYQPNLPFPEIWHFLEKNFLSPDFYADSLKLYIIILPYANSPNVFNFIDETKIQYLLSHLSNSNSERDRAYTIMFFLKFWKQYSMLSIDFVSILNEFNEKYFQKSFSVFCLDYTNGIIDLPILNIQNLFNILCFRISNENNSELFRQNLLYKLILISICNKKFNQFFMLNMENFLKMIVVITSNPYKYPIIYEESKYSLSTLKYQLDDGRYFIQVLTQMIGKVNPFSSSLFLRYSILPQFIQQGIFYSTHEDQLVRENGYVYLRRLIKTQSKDLYMISNQIVEGICTALIESFLKYGDLKALRALSIWCQNVQDETLSKFVNPIMNICTNFVSFESIEIGTTLLRLTPINNKIDNEFVLFLVREIHHILTSNNQVQNSEKSLSSLMNYLPLIMSSLSQAKQIEFMNFMIPVICSDQAAFLSEGMSRLCIKLGSMINLYENQILKTLFQSYSDSLNAVNSQLIQCFLRSISGYCFNFLNFESQLLPTFIKICLNVINEKDTFTHDAIPDAAHAISRAIKHYKENESLFNSLFQLSFKLIYEENDITNSRYLLKIMKSISDSKFFDREKAFYTLNNFTLLFNHIIEIINQTQESSENITASESYEISKIPHYFVDIFENILDICPNELMSSNLIENFMNLKNCPIEIQTAIIDIYFIILNRIDANQNQFGYMQKMIQYLFCILDMMPLQEEQLNQIQQKYPTMNSLYYFFTLQDNTITGFGNLLYEKDFNIEIINKVLEYTIRVISLQIQDDLNLKTLKHHCISTMTILFYKYKKTIDINNTQSVLDFKNFLNILVQWLPNCENINSLTFDCIFKILLLCISTNILQNNEIIQAFINSICISIRNKKVNDTVLRTIYKNYKDSNIQNIIGPILIEIENFL